MEITSTKRVRAADCPDEIWKEILSRLPTKSKFRSKCVSKLWNSLLCDEKKPSWNLLHDCGNSHRMPVTFQGGLHKGLIDDDRFNGLDFSLQFVRDDRRGQHCPVVLGISSNGFFLCCQSVDHPSRYIVCSPFFAQWVRLPPPKGHEDEFADAGIDGTRDGGFRVVQIRISFPDLSLNMQIFSSDVCEWRDVKLTNFRAIPSERSFFSQVVFYNGIMHWHVGGHQFLAYDLSSNADKFRLIDMPTRKASQMAQSLLGVCDGHLRYLMIDNVQQWLCVWTLRDYDTRKWEFEFDFSLSPFILELLGDPFYPVINPEPSSYPHDLRALAFHPFDDELVYMQSYEAIVSINMKTKVLKRASAQNLYIGILEPSSVFPFVLPTSPTPLPQMLCENS